MIYDSIFARSFSRKEQKKLGWGAFFGCLIIALCIFTNFKPYFGPLHVVDLQLSTGFGLKMLMIAEKTRTTQKLNMGMKGTKIICNVSETRSDFCDMEGEIRILGNSSTIFIPSSNKQDVFIGNNSLRIKPYGRKGDEGAMQYVRQFTFSHNMPECTQSHSIPAIIFSVGGYSGNNYHDFSDVVIPLYLTSRKFNGQVQFLMSSMNFKWRTKFGTIIKKLSNYEAMDIDKENDVHCFPRVILGLKKHKELSIDPLKPPYYSMSNFREFLRNSYSLKRETAIKPNNTKEKKKPRLLILSRKVSRAFMNEIEIVKMAGSLGFEVVVAEARSNLSKFAEVVNSCDVMMGVHGAGLTNSIFLPNSAILVQVVPIGLEWVATTYFADPSKAMNLRYLEYKISENESSLIQQYPLDHQVFKDPYSIQKKGWENFRSVYLQNQNVMLDVDRFRTTMLEALKLLGM